MLFTSIHRPPQNKAATSASALIVEKQHDLKRMSRLNGHDWFFINDMLARRYGKIEGAAF
jgi:hypothetical protein